MAEDVGKPQNEEDAKPPAYERPAILWEERLPQGPNLFSACGKLMGQGGICDVSPAS
jgi:hypothetical protein